MSLSTCVGVLTKGTHACTHTHTHTEAMGDEEGRKLGSKRGDKGEVSRKDIQVCSLPQRSVITSTALGKYPPGAISRKCRVEYDLGSDP